MEPSPRLDPTGLLAVGRGARAYGQRQPALRSAAFRRLLVSGFVGTVAQWGEFLGRGWLVHEMTDSVLAVGAVTFAAWMPFVVVGPLAGVAADRMDRRRLVIAPTAGVALMSGLLAVIVLADVASFWNILLIAIGSGTIGSFGQPARQSMVANSVDHEDLLNAISLTSVAMFGSRIFGPLLGAPLLITFGAGAIFAVSAVLMLASVVVLWPLAPQRAIGMTASTGWRSTIDDLRIAVRYIESNPRLAAMIVLVSLHCGLTMAFDSMMPTLATIVGGASTVYSSILVGIGVGSVAGILSISTLRGAEAQGRMFVVAGVGSGLSMVLLGLATTPVTVVLAAAVVGATQGVYIALTTTIIQQTVTDELRGRVISLYWALSTAHMAFLNFGFGWAADGLGVRLLLIVPGLLWTALFLFAFMQIDTVRGIVRGRSGTGAAA